MGVQRLLVNDVDVYFYSKSHSSEALDSVIQFLEVFDCCPELLGHLQEIKTNKLKASKEAAKRRAHTRREVEKLKITEPKQLPILPGERCPKCNAMMVGDTIEACEQARSGREFYRECTRCPFYCETISVGPGLYKVICSEEFEVKPYKDEPPDLSYKKEE